MVLFVLNIFFVFFYIFFFSSKNVFTIIIPTFEGLLREFCFTPYRYIWIFDF